MCGFVGVLDMQRRGRIERAKIERMRDVMAHRGPDGAGAWVSDDRNLGLGHRRLAIIDPDPAAAQPMVSADGRVALVFNGEPFFGQDRIDVAVWRMKQKGLAARP